mgnify:CR=1 FL=1
MKIIVTGSNGMLGSLLCKNFNNLHEIYAFHRDIECLSKYSKSIKLDLIDFVQLKSKFDEIKPDLVIHCASLTNIDLCENEPLLAYGTNVTITENIARLCSSQTKLIYISTDQVYGNANNHSEVNRKLKPLNHYGKTKLEGEHKVKGLCRDYINIRTNIFGWNIKPDRISSAEWIYQNLKNKEFLFLFNDYFFSPLYTEYLGAIIIQLVEMDFIGVVNVGSPKPCSKYDFGIQLAKEFGFDKSCIRKGSIADYNFVAPRCNKLDLNISKLLGLGIASYDYGYSIRQFAQYGKEQGNH